MAIDNRKLYTNAAANIAGHFAFQEAKKAILDGFLVPYYGSQRAIDATDAIFEGEASIRHNLLGLPIWDIITLKYIGPIDSYLYNFNCVLMTITQVRNVIVTPINGLDGTIKEYISDGDYKINLKATIVSDAPDFYPGYDISNIKSLLSIKDNIEIYSTILNNYMGIDSVVVTSWTINQNEQGMRNVQNVEIELLSDNKDLYKVFMLYSK